MNSFYISTTWFLFFCVIDKFYSNNHVNLLFSILSSIGGLYGYLYFPSDINMNYGNWWFSTHIIQMTLSYFTYDIFACIYHHFGTLFLLHGMMSFITYYSCFQGYFPKYGMFFLTYEFSTIFLSLTKIINPKYNFLIMVNQILFAIFFFIFRILWGTIVSIEAIQFLLLETENIIVNNTMLFLTICFIILNQYWFYKVVKKIYKKITNKNISVKSYE